VASGGAVSRAGNFFKRYVDEMPGVAASLTTALIVFLASLSFSPVRAFLFRSESVKEYPLLCFFEPAMDSSKKLLLVEVFVINKTGDEQTKEKLEKFLEAAAKETGRSFSSIINLEYSFPKGEVQSVEVDEMFNGVRGDLEVKSTKGKTVSVSIKTIARYSILKANIFVSGREETLAIASSDNMRALPIPFNIHKFEGRPCYEH
jgi:hypothetical protein